jgi:hypothetical protein
MIPCVLISYSQRFGGTYCLHLQFYPEDAGDMFLRSVGNTYQATLCYNRENHITNLRRRENIISQVR